MVKYYTTPKIKTTVTHDETDIQLEGYSVLTDVILVENGVSQAIIKALDSDGETFLNKIDINDNVKVEIQYSDAPNAVWTQVFGGWAFDLSPSYTEQQGEIVTVQARGYGLGLVAMNVGEEYGTESSNSTLNTIHEVLTDVNKGVIPKWVHKVLNTATDSGYAFDTTKIADVASDFRYLYWSYKPALNCMDDMIDLISAANAPDAGVHWIVIPDGATAYLCLATIGAHENPPADIWPTWWNTDQSGSTIEVKKDMLVSKFTKQRSDANYILYHGVLRKPGDQDFWTENQSGLWGKTAGSFTDDNADYRVGTYSLKVTAADPSNIEFWYPKDYDAVWDMTKWGGKYNIPTLNFWYKRDSNTVGDLTVFLTNDIYTGNAYFLNLSTTANKWKHFELQVGPYSYLNELATFWAEAGTPDWSSIIAVLFFQNPDSGKTGNVWVDGLNFSGWVVRGVRDDTKIGTQKAKVNLIVDNVGKDDSGNAADDSYVMAQLAKAELYRAITTPITGQIVISGKEQILPGQLAHIHFGMKADGNFNIDKNMRMSLVHHCFAPAPEGFKTYLTLTDDVKNSRVLQPNVGYNLLLKATNPNFQNRERASQKTREIDITQPILSKNYDT